MRKQIQRELRESTQPSLDPAAALPGEIRVWRANALAVRAVALTLLVVVFGLVIYVCIAKILPAIAGALVGVVMLASMIRQTVKALLRPTSVSINVRGVILTEAGHAANYDWHEIGGVALDRRRAELVLCAEDRTIRLSLSFYLGRHIEEMVTEIAQHANLAPDASEPLCYGRNPMAGGGKPGR